MDLVEAKTNYLKSLFFLAEYEEYFKFIRAATKVDQFIALFIQKKHILGVNLFYRTLVQYKMVETIVSIINAKELLQDIVILLKEYEEIGTTLFLQNFKKFLDKDTIDVFLKALLIIEKNSCESKIVQKKLIENFSLVTSLLISNELLKEWVAIVLVIPVEYFPKIIDVAQWHLKNSIIYLTKNSYHSTLQDILSYLSNASKNDLIWNKDTILDLTKYFLEQLFVDLYFKKIAITFCRMLPSSQASSLTHMVKKAFYDNEIDKALIYYYLINKNNSDSLNADVEAIFSLLAKDSKKAIFTFNFLESCEFFQSFFPYKVIERSILESLIAIISKKDFPLSLELIKHSQL